MGPRSLRDHYIPSLQLQPSHSKTPALFRSIFCSIFQVPLVLLSPHQHLLSRRLAGHSPHNSLAPPLPNGTSGLTFFYSQARCMMRVQALRNQPGCQSCIHGKHTMWHYRSPGFKLYQTWVELGWLLESFVRHNGNNGYIN